jgi:hypothetical protein
MTPWTTASEVKRYAPVKWDALNYNATTDPPAPFGNEAAFNSFLADTLIPRAQGHINAFCKRDFDADYPTGIPEDVKDVCARAVANMVQYMVMNKMGPLIRTGDYQISIPKQAVLTDELKDDLAAYVTKTNPQFYEQPIE